MKRKMVSFLLIFLLLAGLVVFSGTRLFRGKIKAMHRRVQETDGRLRSL